jgi:peptidoglycan-associated lipoprotein
MTYTRSMVGVGLLAVAGLLGQGCATKSGSGTGEDRAGQEERIAAQEIKEIPSQDRGGLAAQKKQFTDAELAARNTSGMAYGLLRDVLFDFDRDTLRDDAMPLLESNARRLKEDGVTQVILEGRGDEVGTSAYNLMLGERRAKSVKSYLQHLGLKIDFKTTSYGKDRPLCLQHTEDCMQLNRSVHFVTK